MSDHAYHGSIAPIAIEDEMKKCYLDYAMSVIVGRALPDVRDGLKPVHRRIIYAMKEAGYDYTKTHRKSANVVGMVMGKYHPHGDSAIYDAMVRMAQSFSLRLPLIDGQGNFGSMDGDSPAAMRYTEARLSRAAHFMTDDIDKETVDFEPNYDDTTVQPRVLPARFPNLLVNGAGGIAVGMATNIPTHNLGEVIDACCAIIDNPSIPNEDLMAMIPGPDFPTGGIIMGRSGIREGFLTGRGSITIRGRTTIENFSKDRYAIIVTEIPYQVNKARMVERIAELVRQKIIEGISDLRDESNRDGVRVVIELKKDASPDVVLNQLYRYSQLQISFGINMLALRDGRPLLMGLRDMLEAFIDFRDEVITRRTRYELRKAQERAHILLGLAIAVANIDAMIDMIRTSPDPATARARLMEKPWSVGDIMPMVRLVEPGTDTSLSYDGYYRLSEDQAKAILDLRLHRLTALERGKISDELNELVENIKDFIDILSSKQRLFSIMKQELLDIKSMFPSKRMTEIQDGESDQEDEDFIERQDMVVTLSIEGYIKRVPLNTYRAQRRGGKGRSGMTTRDEDIVKDILIANTHTPLLFFTDFGKVYSLKVYKLPIGSPQSRGRPLINMLPLSPGEKIATVLPLPENEDEWTNRHVMFATSHGNVRRNSLSDFLNIRANGKKAISLDQGETLISVLTCTDDHDVFLATRLGRSIRFPATDIRCFVGRDSNGVRGIKLQDGDTVISMSMLRRVEFSVEERDAYLRYAAQQRRVHGDQHDGDVPDDGIIIAPTDAFQRMAEREDFILTLTEDGYGKRTSAYEYRVTNRGGQGITLMDVATKNRTVVSAFPVADRDDIVMVSNEGTVMRCPVKDIRLCGRGAQGVIIFRLKGEEKLVSIAHLPEDKIASDGPQEIDMEHIDTSQGEDDIAVDY